MRLPEALNDGGGKAVELLTSYFAPRLGGGKEEGNYEAYFDRWEEKDPSPERFTADDLMATYLLGGRGFARLVVADLLYSPRIAELLAAVGSDTHLAKAKKKQVRAALLLWEALQELPGVGPATASKLLARKRPKLFPAIDAVVPRALGIADNYVWALREQLRADPELMKRLKMLRSSAGLPKTVSPLRVLDVVVTMEQRGL